MTRILFVCSGNICRSPTAQAVARTWLAARGNTDAIMVDSAGTHDFHQGESPDPRAQDHGVRRGHSFAGQRARPVRPDDLHRFDLIIAMDQGHLAHLQRMAAADADATATLRLLRADGGDVPDPYYQGAQSFERVLDIVEQEVDRLLTGLIAG